MTLAIVNLPFRVSLSLFLWGEWVSNLQSGYETKWDKIIQLCWNSGVLTVDGTPFPNHIVQDLHFSHWKLRTSSMGKQIKGIYRHTISTKPRSRPDLYGSIHWLYFIHFHLYRATFMVWDMQFCASELILNLCIKPHFCNHFSLAFYLLWRAYLEGYLFGN